MSKVTIIDEINIPYEKAQINGIKIYWGQYSADDQSSYISINQIIEEDSDKIKKFI